MTERQDVWADGAAYELYVGRWSRLVAREFLAWLAVPARGRWLDVGCGAGALSQAILASADPIAVKGVDQSPDYVAHARGRVIDERARFEVADAGALPGQAGVYDAVVSGLVLNFISEPGHAVAEMGRVARPGATVAAYVWDYAGEMQLMRHFWDAAAAMNPAARELDEGRRFPICRPDALTSLFRDAGLQRVETCAVDVPTVFRDFDDYWSPFLGGQGPAPGYAMLLTQDERAMLRERIRASLPITADGSISLIARAWAVRGQRA
jgi:SAM-dependent methyltransferase